MTQKELFEEVFGENIFTGQRTQERADKRIASYAFMRKKMGMNYEEIAHSVGKNHATVYAGVKRFDGLIEFGDKNIMDVWDYINIRVNAILAYTDGKILTIDGEMEEVYAKKK